MTVGERGSQMGALAVPAFETRVEGTEEKGVTLKTAIGWVRSDLTVGFSASSMRRLDSNRGLVFQGVIPIGDDFKLDAGTLQQFGYNTGSLPPVIRPCIIGSDIVKIPKQRWLIDFYGFELDEVRASYPELYQHLHNTVRKFRLHNREKSRRERWWLFARSNEKLRAAVDSLPRFIATPDTSKFRPFVFADQLTLPDAQVYCIALEDFLYLGVLSSIVHQTWVYAVAPRHGVGNDPRWKPSEVWDKFPFPDAADTQRQRIRGLSEQLDVLRKHRQQLHPKLTLTGMYNVLEKLRCGEELTGADKVIHEQGLVTVLGELHDELDTAVLDAYGWGDLAPALVGKPGGTTPAAHKSAEQIAAEEDLLGRLVKLNAGRAAEEKQGVVRWLRPEFQAPEQPAAVQKDLIPGVAADEAVAAKAAKKSWPKSLTEQFKALKTALAEHPAPVGAEQLARTFKRAQTRRVSELLGTLAALGQAREVPGGRFSSV